MNKEAIYKRLVEGAIKNKLVDAGVEYGDFLGVIVLPPGKSSSFDRKVYANWEAAFNAIIKPVLVHDIVKLNMAPSEITWAENDLRCLSTWDDDVKKLLDIMYETTDWEPYEEPELIGFVYKHGANDVSLWLHDLPLDVVAEIEKILSKYDTCGCSIRGTGEDIGSELTDV